MFFGRWSDREATVTCAHERVEVDGSQEPSTIKRSGKVYKINDADVTVWDDGTVTAKRSNYITTKPDNVFPNMTVEEGVLKFPIEDMVGLILSRCTPLELAQGLFSDKEVRDELREALEGQYRSFGNYEFTDEDRRKFLRNVKEAVHDQHLHKIEETLVNLETELRSRSSSHRWRSLEIHHYRQLYDWAKVFAAQTDNRLNFEKRQFTHPDKLLEHLKAEQDPVQTESVGPEWHAMRDYWRRLLEAKFPGPEEIKSEDTHHGIL